MDINKTVGILPSEKCCGCGTCFNICPVQAIDMYYDKEGFLAPAINADKCISCGKCEQACPVLHTNYFNTPEPECYAVLADDIIRENSSSGGVFTLAVKYIQEKQGYVCGVVLNQELIAEHVITKDIDTINRMRSSKYIQSNTNKVYTEIKQLLKKDNYVLFSGCPCQVAGLYNFLGNDCENLVTIDLVCHGAPSVMAFRKYIDETYGKENVLDFKFRTKEFGYNCVNQTAYLRSGNQISQNIKFDYFEKGMHSGLLLKQICGDCPFADTPRQADITIGDFWGISKHDPSLNDGKGTSLVLINSPKGKEIFERIKNTAIRTQDVPLNIAKSQNRFGRKINIPRGRDWFFHMNNYQPFGKAVEYALKRKFDVGVIGLWYGRNYGSMATYYALHQTLKYHFGLSVLMIENALKPKSEDESLKTHPRNIANVFYDVSNQYPIHELEKLNQQCDIFLVGSDQLWNVHLSRPYQQTYFLEFVNEINKKIAYGTSFGIQYGGTKEEALISGNNLKRFDHISVRDALSQKACHDLFGVEAVQVCDPSFLCEVNEYDKLVELAKIEDTEPYILAYILDTDAEIGNVLRRISQEENKKIIIIIDENPKSRTINKEALAINDDDHLVVLENVDLYEWMWYYKHADAVLTDSFHGTIFSIIFEKPFLTKSNKRRGAERFVSLLKPLGLMERLFAEFEMLYKHKEMLRRLNYEPVNYKLQQIREFSMKWLGEAIMKPKTITTNKVFALVDNKRSEYNDV